ncbi:hypothetical protein SDC9_196816 [bioreactor metagenome]|uniref:Uncharacterized protein n=1 Tax=bioreactor metagenome TaxID=1076179 RepID=A0A645ICX6_9ZZZZ
MAVFLLSDGGFQGHRLLRDLQYFPDLFLGNIHFCRDFFRGRFPAVFLQQLSGNTDQFVDGFHHMHRDSDGPCLIGNRSGDGLPYPPGSICTEFVPFSPVKFVYRFY